MNDRKEERTANIGFYEIGGSAKRFKQVLLMILL
jgi:hypothetical protein